MSPKDKVAFKITIQLKLKKKKINKKSNNDFKNYIIFRETCNITHGMTNTKSLKRHGYGGDWVNCSRVWLHG
jgi:hypothetical protein